MGQKLIVCNIKYLKKKWVFSGRLNNSLISFRSEKMELYRLTIPKDDAWKVIESLGNKNVAHFVDLNK